MAGLGAAYKDAVGGMMGGGMPPASKFPGGPPPPTGIGAMDTGDAGTPRATAASAIMQLRKLVDAYPEMGDRVDGMISEIKSATSDSAKPTTEPMGGDDLPPPEMPPLPMGGAGAPPGAPPGLPPLPM